MEPQVRYARTSDGLNIGYVTAGSGAPIVRAANPLFSHVLVQWELNVRRYGPLLKSRTLVHFDLRGVGLSDRDVTDFSLDARVRDIEAVVGQLGEEPVALHGVGFGGAAAVAYVVQHPERVSHLILDDVPPSGTEYFARPQNRALAELLRDDWEAFSETVAFATWRSGGEDARRAGERLRRSINHDEAKRLLASLVSTNLLEWLPDVRVPTLVVLHVGGEIPIEAARNVCDRVLDARLVLIEGEDPRGERVIDAIASFLGIDASFGSEAEAKALRTGADPAPSGTAIILFADIADHTALTVRIGDAAFRAQARPLDEALRTAVRDHGGTVVDGKTLGDGILATFPAASQAIAAAFALEAAAAPTGLGLHIGLHAGDVLREVDADGRTNVFGSAVSIASRISALAAPGEVLVSRTVADLARTSAGVVFEDRGEHALKGVAEPQRVFAVQKDGG